MYTEKTIWMSIYKKILTAFCKGWKYGEIDTNCLFSYDKKTIYSILRDITDDIFLGKIDENEPMFGFNDMEKDLLIYA